MTVIGLSTAPLGLSLMGTGLLNCVIPALNVLVVRVVQTQSVGFYVATCTYVMSVVMIMAMAIFASISTVYIPCNNTMIPVKLFLTTPQC